MENNINNTPKNDFIGEAGYMEDIEVDLNRDILCMFHCLSSFKSDEESVKELSTMFKLSVDDIKNILFTERGIKFVEKIPNFSYLNALPTKDLDQLYNVLAKQKLEGENLIIRNEIEQIVANRVIDNQQYDDISNEISNFKKYSEIETWNKFELEFSTDFSQKDSTIKKIKGMIPDYKNTNGIYSIFDKEECLYIGVGRPIWIRIKAHYFSSHKEDKAKRWSDFFSKYKKTLTVYWIKFDNIENVKLGDKTRTLIEAILQEKYKPTFEQ